MSQNEWDWQCICNVQHFQDTHCSVLNLNRFLDIIPKNGGPVSWLKDHTVLIPTIRIFQPVPEIPLRKTEAKRLLVSQRLRWQVPQITIYLAGGSQSYTVCATLESYNCKQVFKVKLNNSNYWLLEAKRTDYKKVDHQGGLKMSNTSCLNYLRIFFVVLLLFYFFKKLAVTNTKECL